MVNSRTVGLPAGVSSMVVDLPDRSASLATIVAPAEQPIGTIVLVHGYTGTKEDFNVLLPLLAERGYNAYAYDQRGQFESSRQGPFTVETFADDAAAFTAAIADGHQDLPIHLLGHSFGGLVVERAGIRHPRTWDSITLMCTGPGGHADAPGLRLMISSLATMEIAAVYRKKRDLELSQGGQLDAPDVEAFMEQRFVAGVPGSLSGMSEILLTTPDQIDELIAARVPVHVVRGERDAAWPQSVQDQMAARLQTSVVVIKDADHSPNVEQPEATADALVRLWSSDRR